MFPALLVFPNKACIGRQDSRVVLCWIPRGRIRKMNVRTLNLNFTLHSHVGQESPISVLLFRAPKRGTRWLSCSHHHPPMLVPQVERTISGANVLLLSALCHVPYLPCSAKGGLGFQRTPGSRRLYSHPPRNLPAVKRRRAFCGVMTVPFIQFVLFQSLLGSSPGLSTSSSLARPFLLISVRPLLRVPLRRHPSIPTASLLARPHASVFVGR